MIHGPFNSTIRVGFSDYGVNVSRLDERVKGIANPQNSEVLVSGGASINLYDFENISIQPVTRENLENFYVFTPNWLTEDTLEIVVSIRLEDYRMSDKRRARYVVQIPSN